MRTILKNHWLVIILNATCLLLVGFALFSVFLPSNVTSHPEYHRWIYKVVFNGNSFKMSDFLNSFNILSFDWVRPRFIDYFFIILNVKFRLFLYNFFIPFQNLSLHFILTLAVAPILFYKFSRNILRSKKLAFYAVALYITSVGFLSNLVTLFQPAKALAHITVLALFLLLSILVKKNSSFSIKKDNYKIILAVLFLNFIGVSVDEGYLVMAAIAPIIFYELFIPQKYELGEIKKSCQKLLLFFLPFLLFLIFLTTLAPELTYQASGARVDYIEWISNKNQEMSQAPVLPLIYKTSVSSVASSFSPIFLLGEKLPIMLKPVWGWQNLLVYFLYVLLIILFLFRRLFVRYPPLEKSVANYPVAGENKFFNKKVLSFLIAMFVFLILQSFLMKMHPVISGVYYYCSLFSVLTSVIVALLFGRGRFFREDILGKFIIVVFMTVQIINFYDLNSRWMLFNKQWIHLESVETFPNLLRSESLIKNQTWIDKTGLSYKNLNHTPRLEQNTEKEKVLWQRWKNGDGFDIKDVSVFTEQDALFLHEMDALMNNKK